MSKDTDVNEVKPEEVDIDGVFPRDNRWGHRINIRDYEGRKVGGHISPMVSDGDTFAYQMESGRIGVFRLVEVDNKLDPKDQFFAEFEPVGYLEEQ